MLPVKFQPFHGYRHQHAPDECREDVEEEVIHMDTSFVKTREMPHHPSTTIGETLQICAFAPGIFRLTGPAVVRKLLL